MKADANAHLLFYKVLYKSGMVSRWRSRTSSFGCSPPYTFSFYDVALWPPDAADRHRRKAEM